MTQCHNALSDGYRGWEPKLRVSAGWFILRAGREGSVPCLRAAGHVLAIVGLRLCLHLHVVLTLGVGLRPDLPLF